MIDRQLRARGIVDPDVLSAMEAMPRHLFVPPDRRSESYADRALPIGDEQTISQPYVVALILEALQLTGRERVLDVGTGSGYQAALLSRLAHTVWSVEVRAELAARAVAALAEQSIDNCHVVVGDATAGLPEHAPYDAIAVAAAPMELPGAWLDQLADGGRLVAPVGPKDAQVLLCVERRRDRYIERSLGPVLFVPLVSKV